MSLDQAPYAELLARAIKNELYELNQVLAGRAEGCLYKLTPTAYARAQCAIREIYAVAHGELELQPTGLREARADAGLQRFIDRVRGPGG